MAQSKTDAALHWLNQAGRQPLLTAAEELHLGALVRAWQDHPDGPAAAPAGIKRRGIKARDRFVCANLRLVAHVAGKRGGAAAIEDRFQQGTIGLIRGAEKFDPARGYKFSTYAYFWILQSLAPANDLARYPVHIPVDVAAYLGGFKNGEVGQERKDAADLWRFPILGLDTTYAGDDERGGTLANVVADPKQPGLDGIADKDESDRALAAMARLDPEVFALMELRELDGCGAADLAELVGISQPAVRHRLRRASETMRHLPAVVEALGPAPAEMVHRPWKSRAK
jgi:hypothetical protein